jgi:hypothetical protein
MIIKNILFYFLLFGSIFFSILLFDTLRGIIHETRESRICGITCSWESVVILFMFAFICSLGTYILSTITKDQLK